MTYTTDSHYLNNATQARLCLQRLSQDGSILHPVTHVLDLIAHSSIGLGEVLQDYAGQTSFQLSEMLRAAHNVMEGSASDEDYTTLRNMHMILKSAKTVLDMTPTAMARNKAESIGEREREKVTRNEVMLIAEEFAAADDIAYLLAAEDSADRLVALLSPQHDVPLSEAPAGEEPEVAGLGG